MTGKKRKSSDSHTNNLVPTPDVGKVNNAMHRINQYPADSVVCFAAICSVDSVNQPLSSLDLLV